VGGRPGEAAIIVTSKAGPEKSYRCRYRLELVDFEVEDENEDGIFEPGEHVFIRRIRVKNTGKFPNHASSLENLSFLRRNAFSQQTNTIGDRRF
jgi:hypothetical protein